MDVHFFLFFWGGLLEFFSDFRGARKWFFSRLLNTTHMYTWNVANKKKIGGGRRRRRRWTLIVWTNNILFHTYALYTILLCWNKKIKNRREPKRKEGGERFGLSFGRWNVPCVDWTCGARWVHTQSVVWFSKTTVDKFDGVVRKFQR